MVRKGQAVAIHFEVLNASKIMVFQGLHERALLEETNQGSLSFRVTPFKTSDELPAGAEKHYIVRAEGPDGVAEEMVTVRLARTDGLLLKKCVKSRSRRQALSPGSRLGLCCCYQKLPSTVAEVQKPLRTDETRLRAMIWLVRTIAASLSSK